MLFLVKGVNNHDYAELNKGRSIKGIMNTKPENLFFSAIDINGNRFFYCISDSKPRDIKIQFGNKNRICRLVNIESLGYKNCILESINEGSGKLFTEPNFIGWFRPYSIYYNPKCHGLSDELLTSIWKALR